MKMKKIEVIQAKAFKIEPNKKYILSIDSRDITKEDAHILAGTIKTWGASDAIVVMLDNGSRMDVIEA